LALPAPCGSAFTREVCQVSGMRQAHTSDLNLKRLRLRLTLARSHHALADSRACRHPPPPTTRSFAASRRHHRRSDEIVRAGAVASVSVVSVIP